MRLYRKHGVFCHHLWGKSSEAGKGECISSPAGRLYGFIQTGAFYNLEAPTTTLSGIAAVKLKNPRGHSPVKL